MDATVKAQIPADKAIVGFFKDGAAGEHGYFFLKNLGYAEDEINVLMSDQSKTLYYPDSGLRGEIVGDTPDSGPVIGAAVGASAGAILAGTLTAAAMVAIPGVNLVAIGPLITVLAGSGFGGLSGGLLGSVLGVAIPHDEASAYEEKLRNGNILIGVTPHSSEDRKLILDEWKLLGAEVVRQTDVPKTKSEDNSVKAKVTGAL